jgi:hypothetical protein
MGIIETEAEIPLELTSHPPVTEERAQELAKTVAACMSNADGVPALCELLLGVAPMGSFENLNEVDKRRLRNPRLTHDSEEISRLLGDLWTRYCAALSVLEALFSYTPEFERAFSEYALSLHQTPESSESK